MSGLWLEARRVGLEALLVGVAGFGIGIAANLVSPRGLEFGRDYFPRAVMEPASGAAAPSADAGEAAKARIAAHGLRVIDGEEVVSLFESPARLEERVIFVDARKEDRYLAGHIPGALLFDHYYPEKHLATVVSACQLAEVVVVYCGGGACEDSEYAAVMLRDAGVPVDRLRVYLGGVEDWKQRAMPLGVGAEGVGVDEAGAGGGGEP